jgi:glutathione S-transferase|tara:strand:- start:10130 stop:10846 length:717 start_codon:yes stop_codon:yes gene_type:complete
MWPGVFSAAERAICVNVARLFPTCQEFAMFKLLSATPSPYARKVRIALAEKNLSFELVTEVPWDSTTSTPKYNPLEKLPVLILDDGTSLYESSYILQYLELKHPLPPLLPPDVDGVLRARKLEVLCDGVLDAVVLIFFERQRPDGGSNLWIRRQQRKIDGGVRAVARMVGEREWCVGDSFSLGDVAVGTMVRYFDVRYPELQCRTLYPNLADLSERLEQRPSFKASVPYAQTISDKVL